MIRAAPVLFLLLAACAAPSNPQVGVHVDTVSGRVSPSLATTFGGVTIAGSGSGGAVGTRIGGIGLSAGF